LIAKITSLSLLLGLILFIFQKRVWKGQFQIVLSLKETPINSKLGKLLNASNEISLLKGISSKDNKLDTEVEILKSPSILKPIFNTIKEQKKASGENIKNFRYYKWVEDSLRIDLKRGTSVLNLSYIDDNQDIIYKVLNDISKSYQSYSRKDRNRSFTTGIEYLTKQRDQFKKKSVKSYVDVQSYSRINDLPDHFLALRLPLITEKIDKFEIKDNNIDIEAIRIKSANKIRLIDQQLIQINQNKNIENVRYIFDDLPQFVFIRKNLDKLDNEISLKSTLFKDNDDEIVNLKTQKSLLLQQLKEQSVNYLLARKDTELAKAKAATRPKDVILKYNELLRSAYRDEFTLVTIENNLRQLSLEYNLQQDPWELITKPTILYKPVYPNKLIFFIFFLSIGSTFGYLSAYYREFKNGLLYNDFEVQNILKIPLLDKLSYSKINEWDNNIKLIYDYIFKENRPGDFVIFPIGQIPENNLKNILIKFEKTSGNKVLVTKNILEAKKFIHSVLLININNLNKNELIEITKKINLHDVNFKGWILVE